MKKILLFSIVIFFLIFTPVYGCSFPEANAVKMSNLMPTYLLDFSKIDGIRSVCLSSNLDADSPVLKTSVSINAKTEQTIRILLPVYGQLYTISAESASLLLNGKKITPSLSYASDPFGLLSSLSYKEILDLNITSELPDLNMPCYYYTFSTDTNGTATFTVPKGAVLFTSFYSHSYSTLTNEYTLTLEKNRPQSLLIFDKDILLSDTENCRAEQLSLICSDVLNYAINTAHLLSDSIETDSEIITEIVKAKFSYCFTSKQRTYNFFDEVINAPFKFGNTFLNYSLTIPYGSSIIESEQRFFSSIDGTYKPPVQNFYVVSPKLQTIAINLTTSRFLLNDGKTDFEKTHQGYSYKGVLSGSFEVGLCTSSIPSPLYPHKTTNIIPVWLIVVLVILSVCLLFCLSYWIYTFVKDTQKK